MQISNTLDWLRNRRIVAAIAALALAVSLLFATSGNSWTSNAAPEEPVNVVVEDDLTLAGPSWTFSARTPAPPTFFGPSWG